jgi:hypothetical protein
MNEAKIYWSDQKNEIFAALAKAQGKIIGASKDSKNPFFNSKYADLNSVWEACRDALSEQGICALQSTQVTPEKETYLCTTLGHASGQWIMSEIQLDIPPAGAVEIDKYGKEKKVNVMQALGSIMTYQKRYQLCSLVGVAPKEDDDGNASQYSVPQQPRQAPAIVPVPVIDRDQLSSIRTLMAQCGNEYTTKIMEWLASKEITSLDKMPVTYFDLVKKRIESHLSNDSIQDVVVEA